MARIFVSYNRTNLAAVRALADDLHAAGHDAWYDQEVTGGHRWWDNILANIRECDIFAFALTPQGLDSYACMQELAYAERLGKSILPVLLAEGVKFNLLPRLLSEIQVVDYRGQDKPALAALMRAVSSARPPAPLPDPLPDPPPVPLSYLTTLKERIDSPGALDLSQQLTLVFDLKEHLRQGPSTDDVTALLLRLRQRPDLLARVADDIDTVLKGAGKDPPPPPAPAPAAAPPPTAVTPVAPQAGPRPPRPDAPSAPPPKPTVRSPSPPPTKPGSGEGAGVRPAAKEIERFVAGVAERMERWKLEVDEKTCILLNREEGPEGTVICARAHFSDLWDKQSVRMVGLGWGISGQTAAKTLGAGALIAATSGIGMVALLSKRVREYLISVVATRTWPLPASPRDVAAIAKDVEAALGAIGAKDQIAAVQQ